MPGDADEIFFAEGSLIDIASPAWQRVPTEALHKLLLQRQAGGERPACGSSDAQVSYNFGLHLFALFLILFLSTAACSFPIIVRRFPQLAVPPRVLFLSRHFGTGVLIATAFVHLLPTAFVSLTDPCLPPFFNDGYPALPGAIAMTAVMVVVGVEMFFASRGAGHVHGVDFDDFYDPEHSTKQPAPDGRADGRRQLGLKRFQRTSFERPPDINVPQDDDLAETAPLVDNQTPSTVAPSPMPPRSRVEAPNGDTNPSRRDAAYRDNEEEEDDNNDSDLELDELDPIPAAPSRPNPYQPAAAAGTTTTTPSQQKALLQVLLLEAGILFHSIFIGMALSVSSGAAFAVFLIAISFHQTFEGLALGARISAISFPARSPRPWLMALAFGATTPLGQAVGLGIHNLYDPQSQTGLIVVGITNAISSGLLLFAGLVALLAEDFLSDDSYRTLVGRRRLEACAAVVLGAGLMALVGAWA